MRQQAALLTWRNSGASMPHMNSIESIRKRLGLTQAQLAAGIEVTQGNVSHYEKGQTMPPAVAARLITFAAAHGLAIGFDHVYGAADVPPATETERAA